MTCSRSHKQGMVGGTLNPRISPASGQALIAGGSVVCQFSKFHDENHGKVQRSSDRRQVSAADCDWFSTEMAKSWG